MPPMNPALGTPRPPHGSMWDPRGKSSFLLSSHHGMYTCIPPTPSQLWAGRSISFGMKPATLTPVVSVRYFPTTPLELARPFGFRDDFELSSSRAVSQELAAITTTFARTCLSTPLALS